MLPSGRDNEERGEEVDEEEVGEIEYWSEEELGEEWEQWEFVEEDDVEEDQEYEEDEEEEDQEYEEDEEEEEDEEDDNEEEREEEEGKEEEKGEEKVPVFPLTRAWSVLPDHAMPASSMATQDTKFVVLSALQGWNLKKRDVLCAGKKSNLSLIFFFFSDS